MLASLNGMIWIKLIKQVWLLQLNSSSFKCFDKRQYFAKNVGYEIPLLIPGILFYRYIISVRRTDIRVGSTDISCACAEEWPWCFLIEQRAHSSLLCRQSSRLDASRLPVQSHSSHSSHSQSKAAASGWLYLLVQSARSSEPWTWITTRRSVV